MFDKSYIYVLNDGYFRYKIGITDKPKQRLKEIRRSMPKHRIRKILSVKIYGARVLEQYLHLFYAFFRSPHKKGSGKTEWFKFIFPVTPILQILLVYIVQRFFFLILGVLGTVLTLYFLKG